jgi:hypothetical protein
MPDRYGEVGPEVTAEADLVISQLTDLLAIIPGS